MNISSTRFPIPHRSAHKDRPFANLQAPTNSSLDLLCTRDTKASNSNIAPLNSQPSSRPLSGKFALAGGLAGTVAGAVAGKAIHGPVGAVTGAIVGLASGAIAGKSLGDLSYSLSLPPVAEFRLAPAPQTDAQRAVNRALNVHPTAESPAQRTLERIVNVGKAAVADMSGEETKKRMTAKYQTLRLLDSDGQWIPALHAYANELLPAELDGKKLTKRVEQMASAASDNPYLMKFLGKAEGESFGRLSNQVKTDGASVLRDSLAHAEVLQRLTSVMAQDHATNEACREHWAQVADSNPEFWKVQNVFQVCKTKSVNLGLDEINKAQRTGDVDPNLLGFVLPLNILEATLVDLHQAYFGVPGAKEGHLGNAEAGWILAKNGPQGAGSSTLTEDGNLLQIRPKAVKAWDDLYATWNMDFITAGPHWPQMITKLLVPSVNDYKNEPETYIHRRALALQTTMYFLALRKLDGQVNHTDWRDSSLSNLWGKTNQESAREYSRLAASV